LASLVAAKVPARVRAATAAAAILALRDIDISIRKR
jgi:hypothetical protein